MEVLRGRDLSSKTAIVTGANSGIGKILVLFQFLFYCHALSFWPSGLLLFHLFILERIQCPWQLWKTPICAWKYVRSHVHVPTHAQNPQTNEKWLVPTLFSTAQSHTPNRNFVFATATLVTVTVYFHNSAVLYVIRSETFGLLQHQETPNSGGYTNLESHVQFQIIQGNG